MNACFHLANQMTQAEADSILGDPDSPECLVQAAVYWLGREAARRKEGLELGLAAVVQSSLADTEGKQ